MCGSPAGERCRHGIEGGVRWSSRRTFGTRRSTSGRGSKAGASGSASRTSRRTPSATWCTSTFPRWASSVEADQPLGEVESTKSVSDVYSPVSGTIVERNPLIDERPELVNEQPYGDGWLVVIEPVDANAVDALLDAQGYRGFLDSAS